MANTRGDSEITLSPDHSLQIDAAVWSHDPGSGRAMGIELVVVHPQFVRVAICVHIHTWK